MGIFGPRKDWPIWISRVRLAPRTRAELEELYAWTEEHIPLLFEGKEGEERLFGLQPLEDWHKSLFIHFGPFRASNWKSATYRTERATHKQIIKPSGFEFGSYAAQVVLVQQDDHWPEEWFESYQMEHLGSTPRIGEPKTKAEVKEALRKRSEAPYKRYPHADGDFMVLGPEIFSNSIDPSDDTVISWKGRNFTVQERDEHKVVEAYNG